MPHNMFRGNACFAEFNEIWDIARGCTRYSEPSEFSL